MNKEIRNIIETEKEDLIRLQERLTKLKCKWFKLAATVELINFLKFYITLKENIIEKLKEEVEKNEVERNAL